MEQNYDSRKTRDSGCAADQEHTSEQQGGGYASNSALTAALGGETPPDPGLGGRMAARMAATFGPAFSALGGAPAMAGAGVVQMKPISEPDRVAPVAGSEASIRGALEKKSSVSLDDVSVHYNSPKPAEIGALAYARGTDVFMGPGQEKYLGHELTHVVQQKQGLVRSTGSVGGMPVNESPALEAAADHMQVSAAPMAAAAPVTGAQAVVQGVFIGADGKELSEKDLEGVISLMESSLDSHKTYTEGLVSSPNTSEKMKKNHAILANAYGKRRADLRKRYMKMAKDKKQHSITEEMSKEINAAQMSARKKKFSLQDADLKMTKNVAQYGSTEYGEQEWRKLPGQSNYRRGAQHTSKGYTDTESGFALKTEAMEGVHDIADYDPELADYSGLQGARMQNSSTFDLARQDSAAEGASQKDKDKLEARKKQFDDAASVAQNGAISLRKAKDDIGFSDLFSIMCGINQAARAGDVKYAEDAGGGKIRGRYAGTGQSIQGVGSGQLPEDVYRTFSTIAAQMNKIKQTKDRDLQKTQAIQLASFAYQMTVSEHIFEDGNGRSCRLLADTILQTFGLPPHSPMDEEMNISGTMGQKFDFDKGANVFLQGIQASDQAMKKDGKVPPAASAAPAAPQTMGEKTSDQTMAYRTTAVPEVFDPSVASDDEKLALLYKKIKNPSPDDSPEQISYRKKMFAELRAQQMKEQMEQPPSQQQSSTAQSSGQQAAPAQDKSKKKWWQFWKK